MGTNTTHDIVVGGLFVEVVRKDIKNLHLGVYPPRGRVRVAAPLSVDDDAVRLAVLDKMRWIKSCRAAFDAQPRQSRRDMVSGESHYVLGRRRRLRVHLHDGPTRVEMGGKAFIDLYAQPQTTAAQREEALYAWYRASLKALIPPLLARWQERIGVEAADWGVKKMKTKWGTCNVAAKRLWFNLELAKKPEACLEYIVVHEMMHLRTRRHDDLFVALMDTHLPHWRGLRDDLNHLPLGHETWP